MLGRTLVLGTPGKLSIAHRQLVFDGESGVKRTFPIEDLGFVIIESGQVLITSTCLRGLSEQNVAVVICGSTHMPLSQLLPFASNSTAQEITEAQLVATPAMQGRLWRQIIKAKLNNQAEVLELLGRPNVGRLRNLAEMVRNGDPANCEAQGARLYFQGIGGVVEFSRDQDSEDILNSALNYGYAVLRAAVARALIGSGLVCFRGIHHHNRYNSYCLADDIMEPYRPLVDLCVFGDMGPWGNFREEDLTPQMKASLLKILTCDVQVDGNRRPLALAVSSTTASLARYYLGKSKELILPELTRCSVRK